MLKLDYWAGCFLHVKLPDVECAECLPFLAEVGLPDNQVLLSEKRALMLWLGAPDSESLFKLSFPDIEFDYTPKAVYVDGVRYLEIGQTFRIENQILVDSQSGIVYEYGNHFGVKSLRYMNRDIPTLLHFIAFYMQQLPNQFLQAIKQRQANFPDHLSQNAHQRVEQIIGVLKAKYLALDPDAMLDTGYWNYISDILRPC